MHGHVARVNDIAPFHPDILHPALRPTVFCPHPGTDECVARQSRRVLPPEEQ